MVRLHLGQAQPLSHPRHIGVVGELLPVHLPGSSRFENADVAIKSPQNQPAVKSSSFD
jgi:hypothetical protein